MKFTVIFTAVFFSISAFSELNHSNYEIRHLNLIVEQISQNCDAMTDLDIKSTTEEVIYVDQGKIDKKFTTILTGKQRMDQNIYDTFTISVESLYSDMYDHTNKDWGVYSVESVKCEML